MIFFLNSANRVYNDRELNKVPGILFGDGVFNTVAATLAAWRSGGDLLVEAAGGSMNITARPGSASVEVLSEGEAQRVIITEENQLSAAVAANVGLAQRNDAVVLRVLQSVITGDTLNVDGDNAVALTVISGSSATELTDSEISIALGGDPFVRLANILVPLSATEITPDMITDARSLVSMSKSVKLGSSVLRAIPMSEDPSDLQEGDIWFNSAEGILKMYRNGETVSLQTEDFDWGYYPPNGIDQNADQFEPIVENDGSEGQSQAQLYEVLNIVDSSGFTVMAGEVFEMPAINNPFIRLKMGNSAYPASIQVQVHTSVSDEPDTLVETVLSLGADEVPNNGYIEMYLDGSLYTPGNEYVLSVMSTRIGFVNANPWDWYQAAVQISSYAADDVLKGFVSGFANSMSSDPTAMTWGSLSTGTHFVMSIGEREELEIGKTDSAGQVHRALQAFVAKSEDITGFRLIKGEDIGTPTGDLTASLYLADEDGNPSGSVLNTATLSEADFGALSAGEIAEFPVSYDQLVVGETYVVVVDTDDHSDDDNYTIFFGGTSTGKAKSWNTADGWESLGGDFFYSIRTSANRKIIVSNDQGLIPEALVPRVAPRVNTVVSAATPFYNIDADALSITALATAITSMTTGKIGTPHNFQRFTFRIKDDGNARNITWGADFENRGATLPTTTTPGKRHTVDVEYDSVSAKWGCVRAIVEA